MAGYNAGGFGRRTSRQPLPDPAAVVEPESSLQGVRECWAWCLVPLVAQNLPGTAGSRAAACSLMTAGVCSGGDALLLVGELPLSERELPGQPWREMGGGQGTEELWGCLQLQFLSPFPAVFCCSRLLSLFTGRRKEVFCFKPINRRAAQFCHWLWWG